MSWRILDVDINKKSDKQIRKNNPAECAVLDGYLDDYLNLLNAGVHPNKIIAGWVHKEPKGLKALGNSAKGTRCLRLYVYPDVDEQLLVVFFIGDKGSQSRDINELKQLV